MPRTTSGTSLRALVAAVLMGVVGCGILGPDLIEDTGTIGFLGIEGGCWTINTASQTLFPLNLSDEFKVEGLEVRFTAERQESAAMICPGTPVHLRTISRTDGS